MSAMSSRVMLPCNALFGGHVRKRALMSYHQARGYLWSVLELLSLISQLCEADGGRRNEIITVEPGPPKKSSRMPDEDQMGGPTLVD